MLTVTKKLQTAAGDVVLTGKFTSPWLSGIVDVQTSGNASPELKAFAGSAGGIVWTMSWEGPLGILKDETTLDGAYDSGVFK